MTLILAGRGFWSFVHKDLGDYTNVPLDGSLYLRDVAEPITMVRGSGRSESDQVWVGLTFVDAKNIERYAKYDITSYAPELISNTLILDLKKIPAGGPEERAFLGLLQRWARQNPEARESYEKAKRERKNGSPLFELSDRQSGTLNAFRLIHLLSRSH